MTAQPIAAQAARLAMILQAGADAGLPEPYSVRASSSQLTLQVGLYGDTDALARWATLLGLTLPPDEIPHEDTTQVIVRGVSHGTPVEVVTIVRAAQAVLA